MEHRPTWEVIEAGPEPPAWLNLDDSTANSLPSEFSRQSALNDAGKLEPPCVGNVFPEWEGSPVVANVQKQCNDERIGIVRAAATGTYKVLWQSWCGTVDPSGGTSDGTSVELTGLVGASHLNGAMGSVLSFKDDTGRYVVKVTTGSHLSTIALKPENLRIETFWPLTMCPWSPTCGAKDEECGIGKCSWIQIRELIVSGWYRGWNRGNDDGTPPPLSKIPIECLRLVLAFAKSHVTATVLNLSSHAKLKVIWRDPAVVAGDLDPGEAQKDTALGRAGCNLFEYYDPASLAMELHAQGMGLFSGEDHQATRCGLLRLVTTGRLWWSAVLHFASFGSSCPMKGPRKWKDVKASQVMNDFFEHTARSRSNPSQVLPIKLNSDNAAAVLLMGPHARKLPLDFLPKDAEEITLEETASIPVWWSRVREPWDRALKIMMDGGGEPSSIGCYFFCGEIGCGAPPGFKYPNDGSVRPCKFRHDGAWKDFVGDTISRPKLCGLCGAYGLQRCSRCKEAFYCGKDCQRRAWPSHKAACAVALAAATANVSAGARDDCK